MYLVLQGARSLVKFDREHGRREAAPVAERQGLRTGEVLTVAIDQREQAGVQTPCVDVAHLAADLGRRVDLQRVLE